MSGVRVPPVRALGESETDQPTMGAPMASEVPQAAVEGGSSDSPNAPENPLLDLAVHLAEWQWPPAPQSARRTPLTDRLRERKGGGS